MSNEKNSGVLFKNNRKEKETHPDYTGSITIGEVNYTLSAWVKTSARTGQKFFSLNAQPKAATIPIPEPTPAQVLASAPAHPTTVPDPVDDLPF